MINDSWTEAKDSWEVEGKVTQRGHRIGVHQFEMETLYAVACFIPHINVKQYISLSFLYC